MTERLDLETAALVKLPRLLSVATTAKLLDCSPKTVRRRIQDGSLPAVTDHGRLIVRGDDLARYIDALERVGRASPSRRRAVPSHRYDFLRE